MSPERRNYDEYDDREARPNSARGSDGVSGLLLVLLGALIAAALIWVVGNYRGPAPPLKNPDAKPREAAPAAPLDSDEREAVELFKKLKPSVVNVDIVLRQRVGWEDQVAERRTGAGSGFIWDDDGRIVTNYHVVADLYRYPNVSIRVTLADRSAWDAVVVGKAEEFDLAVLQFAPHSRPPKDKLRKIDLGTSHDLEVGQKVYAIGNPLGLSLTMTKGIISALDRPIKSPAGTTITGGIQTDAAINPGNSGGPLLDKAGRLIGVNTAIATTTENGGNIGIGFAIPSDLVNQVVTQLVRDGRVLRPDLGIRLYDQQKLRRARYDQGVMIDKTVPGGPADKAGLQGLRLNPRTGRVEPGDLILAINGEPVNSHEEYERAVRKLKPGDTATLKIMRDDAEQEVTVTVGGA
jgi:S1-C subfamily serine protease